MPDKETGTFLMPPGLGNSQIPGVILEGELNLQNAMLVFVCTKLCTEKKIKLEKKVHLQMLFVPDTPKPEMGGMHI